MGLLYLFNDTNSPVYGNLKTIFTVTFIICCQNSTFDVYDMSIDTFLWDHTSFFPFIFQNKIGHNSQIKHLWTHVYADIFIACAQRTWPQSGVHILETSCTCMPSSCRQV